MRRLKTRVVPVAEAEFAEGAASKGRMPPRPALPPLLGCALGLWAATSCMIDAARMLDADICVAIGAGGVLVSLVCMVALWRFRAVLVWAVVLGGALGICCGGWYAAAQHMLQTQAEGAHAQWQFEALSDGTAGTYGSSCFARATAEDGTSFIVQVNLSQDESLIRYGEVFTTTATLLEVSASSAAFCWRQGAVATARVSNVERVERSGLMGKVLAVRARAIDLLSAQPGTASGVFAALVCGWRGGIDEATYGAFKATGLAHVVAVSGAHLSIVSAFVVAALRALRAPRLLASALQVAFIGGYLVLTAAPPSAIRAAVMVCAALLSFVASRRPAALNALAVCMIGFVGLAPQTALSVSFALSVLSTLGIVLFASLFSAWLGFTMRKLPSFVCEALALTLSSSVLGTPLSAALFSQVPLIAPLANVVVAPLFAPVCTVGLIAAAAAVAFPAVAPFAVALGCGGAGFLTAAVDMLAQLPYASIPVFLPMGVALALSAVAAGTLWIAWPAPTIRAAAVAIILLVGALICVVVIAPRSTGDEIIMLDVGQGDAFVVRSQGSAVLIDTGNQDRLLREALARHGMVHLDAIVVTHGDDDHMGSLASLAGVVVVDRVLVAHDALSCGCEACESLLSDAQTLVGDECVQGLARGDSIHVGVFDLTVVWPDHFEDEGGNADSLCLMASSDVNSDGVIDGRALFVGDAERDQMRELIAAGMVGAVDVYKVGHHGSKNALDDETAQVLSPQIALVSAGEHNRYGHPAPETLERLSNVGARILRTDEMGDVSCKFEADRIVVETLR